jgi:uncharacterized membrane protein
MSSTGRQPSSSSPAGSPQSRWFAHLHPFFTHFPISLFSAAFLFQVLHLFAYHDSFDLSTNVLLAGGAAGMIPVLITGWRDWKRGFRGSKARIFQRKIYIGFSMLAVSAGLLGWRVATNTFHRNLPGLAHPIYSLLVTALIAGAVAEGYYGGRLRRR